MQCLAASVPLMAGYAQTKRAAALGHIAAGQICCSICTVSLLHSAYITLLHSAYTTLLHSAYITLLHSAYITLLHSIFPHPTPPLSSPQTLPVCPSWLAVPKPVQPWGTLLQAISPAALHALVPDFKP